MYELWGSLRMEIAWLRGAAAPREAVRIRIAGWAADIMFADYVRVGRNYRTAFGVPYYVLDDGSGRPFYIVSEPV